VKAALTRDEVRVDPGNDSGRDDYGLPRVEIEIPDDARDLDRDVQAYHREVRVRRRRNRLRRLTRPLIGHGMLIPLVAGCLALSLLAGTLLTVLGGRQVPQLPARVPSGISQRPASPDLPSGDPADLPDAQVLVDGREVGLRTLLPALLAWVPSTCGCATTLKQLAVQATQTHVTMYFVGTDGAVGQLPALADQAGQRSDHVVNDTQDVLGTAYQLSRLTAILANGDGSVGALVSNPSPRSQIVSGLRSLTPASPRPALSSTPAPRVS
jgi:hypothetical protein